jgi:hypothetical protein
MEFTCESHFGCKGTTFFAYYASIFAFLLKNRGQNLHISKICSTFAASKCWKSAQNSTKLIALLLEQDSEIIPLEVKSGKDYQRHIALNNLLTNPEYNIQRAIVLCNENVSLNGNVLYAPIYMTMFLHYRRQEGPIIYHPELP